VAETRSKVPEKTEDAMSRDGRAVDLETRVRSEDLLIAHLFHSGEGKIKWIAFGVAALLHLVMLVVRLPDMRSLYEEPPENVIVVKTYVPPPPKIERRQVEKKEFTRKVPVPDPTPDEPEPIREPEPEITPEPLPPDVEFIIGVPEAPPASGPLIAGTGGVTLPERIEESYTEPDYPELARVARIEGRVILQAVVLKDGSVGEVSVLQCNRPNMGFEEAAIRAVQQWRYKPAMQGDRPVDVYFTVRVDFELS
jgi:protein TonB